MCVRPRNGRSEAPRARSDPSACQLQTRRAEAARQQASKPDRNQQHGSAARAARSADIGTRARHGYSVADELADAQQGRRPTAGATEQAAGVPACTTAAWCRVRVCDLSAYCSCFAIFFLFLFPKYINTYIITNMTLFLYHQYPYTHAYIYGMFKRTLIYRDTLGKK
jgi:Flp pilus assembly protein TadB